VDDLFNKTFSEAMPVREPIRISFVTGAGKLDRQKYHADLGKWVTNSLRVLGYRDDRGASLDLTSQGSYKFQHDTGKNLKYVHVFPIITTIDEDETKVEDLDNGEYEDGDAENQWRAITCSLELFKV
jgi:hypothetical protein